MNHLHNFFQNFESHVVLNTQKITFLTGGRTKCQRTKCQNMLRWSGQNANQRMGRTKCQPQKKSGQNANLYLLPNWIYSYGKTQRGFHGKTHGTIQGSIIWQNPLDSKTHRGFHGKTHGTIQGSIIWQNPLDGKSHWGIHGKSHGTKIINLNFGWQQRQYTFRGAIMIFWRLIHISL